MDKGRKTKINGNVITGVVHSGDIQYTINVHCDDRPLTMRSAFEFAAIKCNVLARNGKLKNGEVYNVTPWGDVHKTPAQLVAEMSDEQKAVLKAALAAEDETKAKAGMKKAA